MDIDLIIERELKKYGQVTSESIAKLAGVTRQAAHKHLAALAKQNKLIKVGKTRKSYYIPFSPHKAKEIKRERKPIHLRLINKKLQEDLIFDRMELTSNIIKSLPDNSKKILRYAFTEMLNNAIEHSKSKTININISEIYQYVYFEITDHGIGIFNNLRKKYKLKNDFEALQELLKGKRTTAPKKHSGEGIFFTSKIADHFEIEGSKIRLIMDNLAKDLSIKEIPCRKGTKIVFHINKNSKKDLSALFGEYTNEEYKFSKTKVTIKLYEQGVDYVSRSQGRRLLFGLEKFQTIILDFNKIKGIGQSFADEVFRVFKLEHPEISIEPINANQAVLFMMKRAETHRLQ